MFNSSKWFDRVGDDLLFLEGPLVLVPLPESIETDFSRLRQIPFFNSLQA